MSTSYGTCPAPDTSGTIWRRLTCTFTGHQVGAERMTTLDVYYMAPWFEWLNVVSSMRLRYPPLLNEI